jgi:hypothetical protein
MNGAAEPESTSTMHGAECAGGECISRRLLGHLGAPVGAGCAVEHYELLGDEQMAEWLLSVKERLEKVESAERWKSANR